MPTNKLEWLFQLVDRISTPAKNIATSLNAIERRMNAAGHAANRAGSMVSSFVKGNLIASGIRYAANTTLQLGLGFLKAGADAITFKENALSALAS